VEQEEALRQRLRIELARRRINLVDALPSLQALVDAGELPYSRTRDGHLNPAGQRAVAQLVRAALTRAT
jgi:hypothetical protein